MSSSIAKCVEGNSIGKCVETFAYNGSGLESVESWCITFMYV